MSHLNKKSRASLLGIAFLWASGILAGTWAMLDHEFATGSYMSAPETIPSSLRPYLSETRPYLLVIAVHPECSCTRASIEQVERLLAAHPDTLEVLALYSTAIEKQSTGVLPSHSAGYRETLSQLPHTRILPDPDGALADSLHATLSGAVAVYDQAGQLRFEGGLTASRGHSGSSLGLTHLGDIARALEPRELCSTPVFGCSLENPET